MKYVFWGLGILLGLMVALFSLERIAAERVVNDGQSRT